MLDYQDTVPHYSNTSGGQIPGWAEESILDDVRTIARESKDDNEPLDDVLKSIEARVHESPYDYEFNADDYYLDDLVERALDIVREVYAS